MESFSEILKKYQYFGAIAFIVSVFASPIAIRAAFKFGILDMPDKFLKPHAKPTPYLGGTAICAGWALAVFAAIATGLVEWKIALPILLGGIAMSILGLIDDARNLSPKIRLVTGAVIIATVIIITDFGLQLVNSVLAPNPIAMPLPEMLAKPLSLLLGTILVLGACNSSNLIDGLDGLCAGVSAIISLGFFLLASHLAVWGYSETGDPARLVLSLAMFGAALGFLPWNFNPARIFMGDAGSVLLGYNCGMLILMFAEKGKFKWVIAALLIFALPIFDTVLAMVRRWRSGRSIFEGDRSHFYDQLRQRGLSVKQTVIVCYGLTLLYAGIGLLLTWVQNGTPVIRTIYAVPIYIAVWIITAIAAVAAGLTKPEEKRA